MKYISFIVIALCTLILSCKKKEDCNKWDAWPMRTIYIVFTNDGTILEDSSIAENYTLFTIWEGDTIVHPGTIEYLKGEIGAPYYDDSLFLFNYNDINGVTSSVTSNLYQLHYLQYYNVRWGINTFYLKNNTSGIVQKINITAEEVSNCQAKEIEDCNCRMPLRSISLDGTPLVADQELAEHYGIQWPLYKLYKIELE